MARKRFTYAITTLAGTSPGNLRATCRGHRVEGRFMGKFIFSAALACVFEPFRQFERLVYRKEILNLTLSEPPVFIIGPWRSGTTLLHNLLCQDPAAAYTTTFQTVFPNVILTQSWWLKPVARLAGPSRRPFDSVKMDMDFPQEEEFGLLNMNPHSIYKFILFPKDFDKIIVDELFTGGLPAEQLRKWQADYREMIAKSMINTGGKRYISKNPCNLTRIPILLEMFPGAKFIFIHRHPYEAVESWYRFITEVFPGIQLQRTPGDFTREKVVALYNEIIRSYLSDRVLIPPNDLVEIRMTELTADPAGTIRRIYRQFGLGPFDEMESRVNGYLSLNPQPAEHSYAITPETIEKVNSKLGDVVERFGYRRY